MKFHFLYVLMVSALILSCSDKSSEKAEKKPESKTADSAKRLPKNYLTDCKKIFAEAKKMDSILLSQIEINKASANEAIKAFTDFAYYCSSDSVAPVYLIKTAQVARAINNIPQAKLALDRCIETYPAFRNRPAALFLLAQLYDERNYLNDENSARKLYQQIIDEYPKSDWALSAKGAISFIGKTDEEIMRELKKKK
jgi:hypothetical protein